MGTTNWSQARPIGSGLMGKERRLRAILFGLLHASGQHLGGWLRLWRCEKRPDEARRGTAGNLLIAVPGRRRTDVQRLRLQCTRAAGGNEDAGGHCDPSHEPLLPCEGAR
jgi:hypothetical protein